MSAKTSTSERITAISKKPGKHPQILKARNTGHKCVTANPGKEVVFGVSEGDVVKVTVEKSEKAKSQKRTSPAISSPGQKTKRKESAIGDNKIPQWGSVFEKQNFLYMKAQSSKHGENKQTNKNLKDKKNENNQSHKHTGTISSKGIASQDKSKKGLKDEYVYVQDRGVQYPEICNNANRFSEFNPVRTLRFLMKELKDLVVKKDDRTCKILNEMEQELFRIPVSPIKPISEDLEKHTLEVYMLELKESSTKFKALQESWISERERLQSVIRKQEAQIKEMNQKQEEIVLQAEILTQKLNKVTHEIKEKDDIISALRQQIENNGRMIENDGIISDLRAELSKQIEHARHNEYLMIEIDKLSKVSSYKDSLIIDYKNIIIKLQTQIEKFKLKNLNEVEFAQEESTSSQLTPSQTGHAHSSPTSNFSDRSNKSWHDLSDISSINPDFKGHANTKEDLKFVSLLDGESSHTIMPDQNQVINDKETIMHNNNNSNIVLYRNVNDVTPKRYLHSFSKKEHNKENDMYRMRKFSKLEERKKERAKNSFYHTSKIPENITSIKPMVSDMRNEGYNAHNRIPVNVPSPLRDCPGPNWSDSSLPSVSTASDLDMVPSNDVYETISLK